MMTVLRRAALSALALGALAATAGAQQQAAAQCAIDEGKPNQVKDAGKSLAMAGLLGKPEERRKRAVEAIKLMTTAPEKITNPVGRNYMLGRALVLIATEPNAQQVVPRASIGYATDPTGNIDVLAAADSAFDAVEQAMPACKSETEQYRRAAYAPLANAAIQAFNAQQVDSAQAISQRAIMIDSDSPVSVYAYLVLGNAYLTKDDYANAIEAFSKLADVAKGDTSVADERRDALIKVPDLMVAQAEKLEGAAKTDMLNKAAARYLALTTEFPNEPELKLNLARVYAMSGDSTKAGQIYSDILANKEKYSDYQLFRAGEATARAEHWKEASQLFEAGLAKNQFFRDGLANLAITLLNSDQYDKMPPVLAKLIAVDPSNPDNFQLWAQYFRAKANAAKPAAEKKPPTDPAVKAYAAQNDSLLKYFKLYQESPVKLTVNLFSHDGTKHTLGGSVLNRSQQAKSYDVKIEFLDANGNVVSSATTKVDAVGPNESKAFRVQTEGAGIVAYRYAPLAS
jgi:tetratricopeptide (TPR) repeat protein